MQRKIAIILVLIILFFSTPTVYGTKLSDSNSFDDFVFPDDFNFKISEICSSHQCFHQMDARIDGAFILVSRYTNIRENKDLIYRLCYIDVYAADGSFLLELSFYTEQDFVAELTETGIMIYFYDHIIIYDLVTSELEGFYTTPGEALENGTFRRLRQASLALDAWSFSCKKGFHGYTQLVRTDECGNELKISFSGTGFTIWNTLIPALIVVGVFIIFIVYFQSRKKKR